MKKLFILVISFLLFLLNVQAEENDLVKVYVFTQEESKYCVSQLDYLKGLDSYNTKFTIVEFNMYTEDWADGEYYDFGTTVIKAFNDYGLTEISSTAVPSIIISDVYAKSGYQDDLESIINEVYEDGDKDIVGCYLEGNTDCLEGVTVVFKEETEENNIILIIIASIICLIIIALLIFLIKGKLKKKS